MKLHTHIAVFLFGNRVGVSSHWIPILLYQGIQGISRLVRSQNHEEEQGISSRSRKNKKGDKEKEEHMIGNNM